MKTIKKLTEKPIKYRLCEFEINVDDFDGNPFNPEDISIEATIKCGEKSWLVHGFYYEEFSLEDNTLGDEPLRSCYRIRFAPLTAGYHTVSVNVLVYGKKVDEYYTEFVAEDGDDSGYIGIEPKRRQAFCFNNGNIYYPVGQNLAWAMPRGDEKRVYNYYKEHIDKISQNGGNFIRVWSSIWNLGLYATEKSPDDFSAKMDQAEALDAIMELLRESGVYMSLTIWPHNFFTRYFFPLWYASPFNVENGGYLTEPSQFYTNERAKKDAKKYLRYINARWGYSPNIFCYEMFNEIDGCEVEEPIALEWHREMIAYLKEIDSNRHLVTTSTANVSYDLMRAPLFDFIYYHIYTHDFISEMKKWQVSSYNTYGKPVFFGELGATGDEYKNDPEMYSFHQMLWAGAMICGSGTGMSWWWDNIHESDLYSEYRGISSFVKKIPWADRKLRYIGSDSISGLSECTDANGYRTDKNLYLWIRDENYSFFRRVEKDKATGKIPTGDLAEGNYSAIWYDFTTCKLTEYESALVSNGELHIDVSDNKSDIFINIIPIKRDMGGKVEIDGMECGEYEVVFYSTENGDEICRKSILCNDGNLCFDMPVWSGDISLIANKI